LSLSVKGLGRKREEKRIETNRKARKERRNKESQG
jgi:hypothetical protein